VSDGHTETQHEPREIRAIPSGFLVHNGKPHIRDSHQRRNMTMIDEVYRDIYRIEIPLPRNPLRIVNAYLVNGEDRNLLIDTGMNRPESIEAMRADSSASLLTRPDGYLRHPLPFGPCRPRVAAQDRDLASLSPSGR